METGNRRIGGPTSTLEGSRAIQPRGELTSAQSTPSRKVPLAEGENEHGVNEKRPLACPSGGHDRPAELGAGVTDRVFPIRSVVSVDPTPTPSHHADRAEGYFQDAARLSQARRQSTSCNTDSPKLTQSVRHERASASVQSISTVTAGTLDDIDADGTTKQIERARSKAPGCAPPEMFNDISSSRSESEAGSGVSAAPSADRYPVTNRTTPVASAESNGAESGPVTAARFKHVISEGGHAVITGRNGETIERCEDEPIHIPGAIQGFGVLLALQDETDGKLIVKAVSENSKALLGYSPRQLFALESFCDILSEEQTDNLLDHIDFISEDDADVATNGPEVFTLSIRIPYGKTQKFWCAIHVNERNPGIVICELELEDDQVNPLAPYRDTSLDPPEATLHGDPTPEEYAESTKAISRPLRVLRSARKRKGEAAAMEVFNIMSQVQEQLAAAPNLQKFLKILVGVVKELTGFHRVMVYQFDAAWNGRVVTELVDPRTTKDLYKGLHFPASDIPKQARELYKINKVRLLYDRDQETARLVCRTPEDLEAPLDLSYAYLRAMSPVHLKYLANMAVRSSMSISINAFNELWGLIACHSYGTKGMRVSFPIRKMCRLVGDTASRNIERLSYASRLQARKLINTVPTQHNPSGYIVASSEDLLKLFDADFGVLSIRDETKILGELHQSHEGLAMVEYLRMRRITSVTTSQDINQDFPDLRYGPGFQVIAGLLLVPLSFEGHDFIVFFRKCQVGEVKWAGNPNEKLIKEGTEGYLEPRTSFKTWTETVVGKCREWSEDEIETAAVLCLVYGKFIEVWRQREAALQNTQLTRLLLANSAHEVRTPLNAIINYLEIALEGSLDSETRENLTKSHSASKSLIYVINDLLDLTKAEEGAELVKGEIFDLQATLQEVASQFEGDAKRKGLAYNILIYPGVPTNVVGDQRKVRQAISNVTANAIKHTKEGYVKVEMYLATCLSRRVEVEVAVQDSGIGMSTKKLDSLFMDLEQVQSDMMDDHSASEPKTIANGKDNGRTLGLGLAVVARIIRNMNGQLRLKSEEGKGSRFVIQLPFDLPESEEDGKLFKTYSPDSPTGQTLGEVTLVGRGNSGRGSFSSKDVSRKNSAESIISRRSLNSFKSANSGASGRSAGSDVDWLIEAIREPHLVEKRPPGHDGRSGSRSSLPRLQRYNSHTGLMRGSVTPERCRTKSVDMPPSPGAVSPAHLHSARPGCSGQAPVMDSGTPIKAIKMPDSPGSPETGTELESRLPGVERDRPQRQIQSPSRGEKGSVGILRVLVAEDDPVNSKIVKKRLEKAGHEIHLTVNGEQCAATFGEMSNSFDVVLMDMQVCVSQVSFAESQLTKSQMPIADGLSSTKMIRAFEESHPAVSRGDRTFVDGRVPIIAVSASLVERDMKTYVDAGFDGWILKPISFPRLNELLNGIVDQAARTKALYRPGEWEKGGWFTEGQPDTLRAITSQTAPIGCRRAERVVKRVQVTSPRDRTSDSRAATATVGSELSASDQSDGRRASKSRSAPNLRKTMTEGESSRPESQPVDPNQRDNSSGQHDLSP